MNRDRLYLLDIADSIYWIEMIVQDGREAFMQSRIYQDAVIRNFEIIGEAAKLVSPELKQAHPDVPWHRVSGLRDVLIHQYHRVDLEVVWQIIEGDLPDLKQKTAVILGELDDTRRSQQTTDT